MLTATNTAPLEGKSECVCVCIPYAVDFTRLGPFLSAMICILHGRGLLALDIENSWITAFWVCLGPIQHVATMSQLCFAMGKLALLLSILHKYCVLIWLKPTQKAGNGMTFRKAHDKPTALVVILDPFCRYHMQLFCAIFGPQQQ